MAINREYHHHRIYAPLHALLKADGVPSLAGGVEQISNVNNLTHALKLASRYHFGGLRLTDDQLHSLVKRVKDLATVELEPGDGRKVESVRVERKMDGSASIFFGI